MQKDFKILCAIALTLFGVSSCSTVKIKDYEMFGDLGKFGAIKVHTLFTEIPPVKILKPEWDDLRIGMVCTDANSIADIQATVDKLCARNPNACDYEKMANFKASMRKVIRAQQLAGAFVDSYTVAVFAPYEWEIQ
jgi:hypothetical protein